jgi:hypothetical protein
MNIRNNPKFPVELPQLSRELGVLWRELSDQVNSLLKTNNNWTAGQRGSFYELVSASGSIDINLNNSNNFNHTLTENTTLASPSNPVEGQSGIIHITQVASGYTFAVNSFWYFGPTTPTISSTDASVVIISYIVEPGAIRAMCSMVGDTA